MSNQAIRIVFFIIVLLHVLIHLLGFVKGFELKEVKELALPVSKPMGLLWLLAAIILLIFGVLNIINSEYAWPAGFLAVAISQMLIVLFWKDARFGTIINFLILFVAFGLYGDFSFQKMNRHEVNQLLNQDKFIENKIIEEADIQGLPEPVKSWLRSSGMIGRPFIRLGRVTQTAVLKMKPDADKWLTAKAVQYTTTEYPAFLWTVDVQMNGLLNFRGRDKFESGKGSMLIKLNSLLKVVDESGGKIDEGALQRFLGEMVWFPSLALSPYISWEQLSASTAKATMTYEKTTGSGIFHFNSQGDVVMFSALRFKDNLPESRRYEWIMNITDYRTFEGIRVPAKLVSTWKLDHGDWTWLKLEVTDLKYYENANPPGF